MTPPDTAMTTDQITAWLHNHPQVVVSVEAVLMDYTGLVVTVTRQDKTAKFGPTWDFVAAVAGAIQNWEAGNE